MWRAGNRNSDQHCTAACCLRIPLVVLLDDVDQDFQVGYHGAKFES